MWKTSLTAALKPSVTVKAAFSCVFFSGLKVPSDRIYGLGSGPKVDVLSELKARHSGSIIHFFEDRVETLEGVCSDSRLKVQTH